MHTHQRQVKSQMAEIPEALTDLSAYSRPSEITGPTAAAAPAPPIACLPTRSLLRLGRDPSADGTVILSPKRAAREQESATGVQGLNFQTAHLAQLRAPYRDIWQKNVPLVSVPRSQSCSEQRAFLSSHYSCVFPSIISWLTTHPAYSGGGQRPASDAFSYNASITAPEKIKSSLATSGALRPLRTFSGKP